jgi:ethanolamine utilization protein EutM
VNRSVSKPVLNLAFVQVYGLSPALAIADKVLKAADVRIAGVEGDAGQDSLIKFIGDAANCTLAAEVAREVAARMNARFSVALSLAYDESPGQPLVHSEQEFSGISQGNLHLLPRPRKATTTTTASLSTKGWWTMQALGLLETQGLIGALYGADAMLKAANVEIVGKEKIGAAHVTIMIRGDVAAVTAAIEAGKAAAARVGKVVSAEVISRPHESLARLLPE